MRDKRLGSPRPRPLSGCPVLVIHSKTDQVRGEEHEQIGESGPWRPEDRDMEW
jgi:hypothetical protein